MAGIKELKEVLEFAFNVGDAVSSSLSDGKINYLDLPNFLGAVMNSPKAIAGINQVGAELMDLSDEERDELSDYVKERFDIPDDQLEYVIENLVRALLGMFSSIVQLYKYTKSKREV